MRATIKKTHLLNKGQCGEDARELPSRLIFTEEIKLPTTDLHNMISCILDLNEVSFLLFKVEEIPKEVTQLADNVSTRAEYEEHERQIRLPNNMRLKIYYYCEVQ